MSANFEEVILLQAKALPGRDDDIRELVTRWDDECRVKSAMILEALRGYYLADNSQLDRIESSLDALRKGGLAVAAQAPMETDFDDLILDSDL